MRHKHNPDGCNRCGAWMYFSVPYCRKCAEKNRKAEEYKHHYDKLKAVGRYNEYNAVIDCFRGKLHGTDIEYALGIPQDEVRQILEQLRDWAR